MKVCTVLFLFSLFFTGQTLADSREYKIGAGELLSIIVFDEPDLSLSEIRVATDGTISIPLLGQINVSGLTVKESEKKLASFLADGYLKNPRVAISILKYRVLYVTGQVRKPGAYDYSEGLTVGKAIVLAGGLTPRGSKNKITLARENNPDTVISVNGAIIVGPGDVITVGESFF
ncbi:MAG: polysaccharide export protein [Gammaproteobacteria bacterium]|nr:polysaccharide export protein [Gammaproteobacteria bacterium]